MRKIKTMRFEVKIGAEMCRMDRKRILEME